MKKALSVVLAMLVMFSMLGVAACAEGEIDPKEYVTVEYYNDGNLIKTIYVAPGTIIDDYVPENPTKPATETEEYIFKGWRCTMDDELYNGKLFYEETVQQVFESCELGSTIRFDAEYSKKDISERQSFWNFVESIFERINLIFQYFAKVFEW